MKERLSPAEQQKFTKMVLDGIDKGEEGIMDEFIRGYLGLRRQVEGGNKTIDPRMVEELEKGFSDVFGSQEATEMVLSRWQDARDSKRFPQS